jgi:tetratricopeptide (TPR) repeat protein
MLKPKKKISRKEIKKDPVLEKISQIEHLVREKSKVILYVVVAVVILLVLSFAMIRSKQNANRQASGELGMAELALASGDIDNAIVQFEAIVEKNPNTEKAGMATIILGQTHILKDDYEKAETYFWSYIKDYKDDNLLTAAAYNGLGACNERAEDFKQAAVNFEKGGNISSYKFLKNECYINAIRANIKTRNVENADRLLKLISAEDLDYRLKTQFDILKASLEVLKG